MEDIQIWSIDGSQVSQLDSSSRMESELLLEETLVSNPGLLLEGMTLVGRQTPTQGGPLDLLGVDADGKLVVFELKRGTLSREAVAQVIDYASYLDGMGLADFTDHISKNSGAHGIDKIENFREWYDSQGFGELTSLKPLRMFLVGLGADERTERMVRFLAENSDMDISLLTFHGFEYDGKMLLAKQVEVDANSAQVSSSRRRGGYVSRAERRRQLDSRAREHGIQDLFDDLMGMFRKNWPDSREIPRVLGIYLRLRRRAESGRAGWRPYARVGPQDDGRMQIVFFPNAVELCRGEFGQPVEQVPFRTWPHGREEQALETPDTEIQFLLTADDWETHKEKLTTLVQAVYEAWQSADRDDESDSA